MNPAPNVQAQAIRNILQTTAANIKGLGSAIGAKTSNSFSTLSTPETGSFILNMLFYIVLYAFVIFLLLALVHFTVYPIFRFRPGQKGLILIPGLGDNRVYWNNRKQPPPLTSVSSDPEDSLSDYPFINNFSFCLDLYIRRLTVTDNQNRLVLAKANAPPSSPTAHPLSVGPGATTDLVNYAKGKTSMIMYFGVNNDLNLLFFSGSNSTEIPITPIQNIPLNTPFRICVVVEERLVTIYLNGKQVAQRTSSTPIELNTGTQAAQVSPQKFYSAPAWSEMPMKSIYVQNFNLWPRALSYPEVAEAQPALAKKEDFNLPPDPRGSGACAV
jgi:hypothetical protein